LGSDIQRGGDRIGGCDDWAAPRSAASLSESLSREAERHDQLQKRKMKIFTILMRGRESIRKTAFARSTR